MRLGDAAVSTCAGYLGSEVAKRPPIGSLPYWRAPVSFARSRPLTTAARKPDSTQSARRARHRRPARSRERAGSTRGTLRHLRDCRRRQAESRQDIGAPVPGCLAAGAGVALRTGQLPPDGPRSPRAGSPTAGTVVAPDEYSDRHNGRRPVLVVEEAGQPRDLRT